MKRSYDMIVSPEQQAMKLLNFSARNLLFFPMNFLGMYPQIESLVLSHNQLDETSYAALEKLIKESTTLNYLDLSYNPLPSQVVVRLHEMADSKMQLVSDFSLWRTLCPEHVYPRITWALSPAQWRQETQCREVFEKIAELWVAQPESRDEFIEALIPVMNQKNRMGWTPLVCMTRISSPILINEVIDRLGIETFTQRLISHSLDLDSAYFVPHTWLPSVIHHCYLTHARNSFQALRLVRALLPEICGARCEILGNLAAFQQNYAAAYQYYIHGVSLRWPPCHYSLAVMIRDQLAPDILPFNQDEITFHLGLASQAGNICAMLDLGKAHEDAGELCLAYNHYNAAKVIVEQFPNILHGLFASQRELYIRRMQFSDEVTKLINSIIIERVELVRQRALGLPQTCPAFNKHAVYIRLCDRLGEQTTRLIFDTVGCRLLQKFMHDPTVFKALKLKFSTQVQNCRVPNKGLLAMAPTVFAQAMIAGIEPVLIQRFGSTMPNCRYSLNKTT